MSPSLSPHAPHHLLVLVLGDAASEAPTPVYDALAEAFARCEGWTAPAADTRAARRAQLLSARPAPSEMPPGGLPARTLLAAVGDDGARWRAYHRGRSSAQLFAAHPPGAAQVQPLEALLALLDGPPTEALPQLSWIDGAWDGAEDEATLARVYDALVASAWWERSLLWVVFDAPDEARPPLLISPWLPQVSPLPRPLRAASLARSALDLFARGRALSPTPSEAEGAPSLTELTLSDAPRRDQPTGLSAHAPPLTPTPAPTPPTPGRAELAERLAGRLAARVDEGAETAERRAIELSEQLEAAASGLLKRLSRGD